jgi:hypothetical protein
MKLKYSEPVVHPSKLTKLTNSKWVYLDEVHFGTSERPLYLVTGRLYPYKIFEIMVHF